MKKKKKFVVPGVLQVCEVALEENLLGASHAVQYSTVETTGQHTTLDGSHESDSWSVGADFD